MSRQYGAGLPVTVVNQSIYEESSTAKHVPGTRLIIGDRTFYYGHFVAANAAGLLCASDQSLAGSNGLLADGSFVALAAAVTSKEQKACTAILAVGQTWVAITHASAQDNVTKDLFKGGYICISDSANYDQIFKIKSNSAFASSGDAADIIAIELYDPILTATADATTGCTFIIPPFEQLRPAAVSTDENVVGAPQIAVQAAYYAWVQTYGPGMAVTVTDTAFAGIDVELGGTGQVATRDTHGVEPRVGVGLADVTTAGDATIINYQLCR